MAKNTQTSKHQSPIEQQHYRSCLNLITILISLFILISITIGVYHIFRYFMDENISRKSKQRIIMITTNIIESINISNKTKY
jgi:divalent metal cation (Fe/Co/Zn/Cd) transporter